jgi:zinc transporter ZupT
LQGVLTTLAIGVHNIPEGLAKATVLVGQGVSPRRALGWSVLTCLPQPLVAIPSFVFVDAFMVSEQHYVSLLCF